MEYLFNVFCKLVFVIIFKMDRPKTVDFYAFFKLKMIKLNF